ncbi:hypothetical protein [Sphingomicrobium lutaoense]|uniref:Uncharacterized protein n=1 Tax=Sphingomicrobium lutaoense TaxID=515949 RepID=A0A839YWU9_9SPHN|nr:hypothetical protein [Sphingomicrobium lutaoense]MBB3764681.1 hypothetical protein [Sphingomicrobium lutaoense]
MVITFLLLAQAPALAAEGRWAVFELDTACEARTRSWRVVREPERQPRLTFSFAPGGEVMLHSRLRRTSRPRSTVTIAVDGQPFLLEARGADAWSKGNEQAIIAALRTASRLRVTATDRAGRRFTDYYPTDGVQTAIDGAAACAAKKAGNAGA